MDKEEVFRFKNFEVVHGKGSMKVGVDAVLLGSWAGENEAKILDVGTGCGVIALILAQRFPKAIIEAIDIDFPSVKEAAFNFSNSPWDKRLKVRLLKFPEEINNTEEKYDLIVSNPPYFKSGITSPATQREKARHQDSLSVFSLLRNAQKNLEEEGKLAIIFPRAYYEEALMTGENFNLLPNRICFIRDNEFRQDKRVMVEFTFNGRSQQHPQIEQLTLFDRGEPTIEYRKLCHEFYLKF